jgi:hypothetical protein
MVERKKSGKKSNLCIWRSIVTDERRMISMEVDLVRFTVPYQQLPEESEESDKIHQYEVWKMHYLRNKQTKDEIIGYNIGYAEVWNGVIVVSQRWCSTKTQGGQGSSRNTAPWV